MMDNVKIIVFDTETTGIPSKGLDLEFQPYICQFAAVIYQFSGGQLEELKRLEFLIKPPVAIEYEVVAIHGISNKMVADAPAFAEVVDRIMEAFREADVAVAHNLEFDRRVLACELERLARNGDFLPEQIFDTMKESRDFCAIPSQRHPGKLKAPKLEELHHKLFGEGFEGAHDAMVDVLATGRCLQALAERGIFQPEEPVQDSLF